VLLQFSSMLMYVMFTFSVCLTHCCDFQRSSNTLRNQMDISFTDNKMSNTANKTLLAYR